MDKQHAKFILQSYRPDGADASNPDFTNALKVVAEDRGLSSWLADERAHDAMFVEALETVDIPEGLRDEILSVMEHDGVAPDIDLEMDSLFMGAMVEVAPPAGLRDQILSAMAVENDLKQSEAKKVIKFPTKWLNVAAIAAVVLLGATFVFPGAFGLNLNSGNQLQLSDLQVKSGRLINASYEVDMVDNSLAGVNTWLESEGMPVATTIPQGLISSDTLGGKKFVTDNGVQASMISFKKKNSGDYYLMVLEVDSIGDVDKLVSMSEIELMQCKNCPMTHFTITSWRDETKAYMLLSKAEQKDMFDLF